MTVIGLTGKVCAGKNQYADLERSGAEVIDVDRLGIGCSKSRRQSLLASAPQLPLMGWSTAVRWPGLSSLMEPPLRRWRYRAPGDGRGVQKSSQKHQGRSGGDQCGPCSIGWGLPASVTQVIFVKAPLLVRYRRCRTPGLSWKAFWARNRAQRISGLTSQTGD